MFSKVYQANTGKFLCRDKYYGRKLSVEGFKEAIYQFLHNGNRLRTDAILPLVEKLEDLKATLSTLDTYRFYTSSLLLSYEGLDPELHGDAEEQQMIISDDNHEDNDHDIQGKNSLVVIPTSKSADQFPNRGHSLDDSFQGGSHKASGANNGGGVSGAPTSFSADNISHLSETNFKSSVGLSSTSISSSSSLVVPGSDNNNKSVSGTPTANCLPSESVAVKVIDFAHATHTNMGYYAKEHIGPDSGYIFGISSLIKVLREIYEEECA
ncbi:Inositol hexakisphosphate kinase 3 [Orchesella cincta]|uniref:Kinase n=1 Tax=Orchesella cincta TaxID=48709 RepID=A0A1D2NIX8_ORCCI|nr:Inositol hexakisphosphate kinase 3 [Orchesella cincta]